MPTDFSRTLRELGADGFRPSLVWMACACALLAGWALWSVESRITLYEVSASARLEIDRAAFAVESPLGGSVTRQNLAIGRQVKQGDVLVELDSTAEKLQLEEEQSRVAAGEREIAALHQQIAVEEKARADEQRTAASAVEVTQSKVREAAGVAEHAAIEAERLQQLHAEKLAAQRDYASAQSEARRANDALESARSEVRQLQEDQTGKASERGTRISKLATDLSRLEGQQEVERSVISRLRYEIERRKVRAATSGKIGEAAIVRSGGVVSGGEKLAAILPEGHLLVAAQFPPAAMGRIRAGQKARVRMVGYSWTQYGALSATVARVSSEVRDGTVRVELNLDPEQKTSIPLQHGLPGSVEVAVGTESPARLAMRLAGGQAGDPR